MQLIAHRGFADERAENTIPALQRGAAIADAVEFDVRRCASGEPVVIHDETVDRVTDSSGPVAEYDADALAAMDVLGSGDGVPTLAEAVAAIPTETPLLVELKERGLAEPVLDALSDRDGRVLVASFDEAALRELRAADSSAELATIAGDLRDRPIATAVELDCSAVMVRARLAALPTVRRAARDLDLDVFVWTVQRRPVAGGLAWLGVDGVIIDRSDVVPGRS
ncbi:glycerophosphoryl diester phosphodiesterase [Salinarchaeum sp. Harcht-Bsk1]|uniref:glycerophosphodiester phosphodiesterase n=1 Tax=Salinarchaeum sp. Harcht-Bsk1 TaxID=1333523 RepID=UPI00034235E2|nr:glycerophosphodiester phosphodiesterase family protein [Salinarchaeum sp. Harcht-Bsk1]AGN01336.1 glycerophosphoryl diester phosphodiesterase [Salinarchaeum sp. Harcht-Bsk1]